MRGSRAAFTLVEVLVGAFVLLIVMTVAYALTVLTMRYTLDGQDRISVHVNGAYSVQRLWLRMHEASIASLTDNTASSPQALSFLTCRSNTGTVLIDALANPNWQAYAVYYLTSANELRYRSVVPAGLPTTIATPLSAAALSAYCDGSGEVVASAISSLALSGVSLSSHTATVSVTASTGTPVIHRTTYTTVVYFKP